MSTAAMTEASSLVDIQPEEEEEQVGEISTDDSVTYPIKFKVNDTQQQQHGEQGSVDSTQESSVSGDEGEENNMTHDDDDALDEEEEDDDDDEEEEDEDSDDEEEEAEIELDCAELLERAQDRIARQHLTEEVEKLQELLERKDEEIERLAGQLRRAVTTKSDLVSAHTDLERMHHDEIQQREDSVQALRKSNVQLLEDYSQKEKDLLNELVMLTEKLFESEKRHRAEREDMTRRHTNQMLEKDFEIAQLTVKLQVAAMKNDDASSVNSRISATSKTKSSKNSNKKVPPPLK